MNIKSAAVQKFRISRQARGERTFYGAFEGGFSAGYWGTVGSKEGWEPASFSSSAAAQYATRPLQRSPCTTGGRSKRHADAAPRVEDYMDEEETAREIRFATNLQLEKFKPVAWAQDSTTCPESSHTSPHVSAADLDRRPTTVTLCRQGLRGPAAWHATLVTQLQRGYKPAKSESAQADVGKTDLHGIGYFLGGGSGCGSGSSAEMAIGYSQFGTGVLDQDEYDACLGRGWDPLHQGFGHEILLLQKVYDHETDKSVHYHPALKDEARHGKTWTAEYLRIFCQDVEEEVEGQGPQPRALRPKPKAEEVPGFVKAEQPDKAGTRDRGRRDAGRFHQHPPAISSRCFGSWLFGPGFSDKTADVPHDVPRRLEISQDGIRHQCQVLSSSCAHFTISGDGGWQEVSLADENGH
eukprot:Skav216135  [mRNA]  locus=scaffold1946:355431:361290:+ [translate_table: standard]